MDNKEKFVECEILDLTIRAGLSRGEKVYKEGAPASEKERMKHFIIDELLRIGKSYEKEKIDEDKHIKNIEKFRNNIEKIFSKILVDKTFKFGRAQKLLNLYLKYLWVLGRIEELSHCPIDSIVIGNLKKWVSWTKMDDEKEYKKIIEEIREIAKEEGKSISEWELDMYNKKRIEKHKKVA